MTETYKIYVNLLDEGTNCWRPVNAERVQDNCFKITSVNPDPEDENWQFTTGTVVRCEEKELSGGKALVAIEEAHEK